MAETRVSVTCCPNGLVRLKIVRKFQRFEKDLSKMGTECERDLDGVNEYKVQINAGSIKTNKTNQRANE